MGIPFLAALVGGLKAEVPRKLLSVFFDLIDKTAGTQDDADKIKAKTLRLAEENKLSELNAIAKIVEHEIKSDHWLQRSWRPILMLCMTLIIINTYILMPYINLFLTQKIIITLPDTFYDLLIIGVGGYVVGRSVEKSVRNWRGDIY